MAVNTGDTSIDYHLLLQRFFNPALQVVNTSLEGEAAGNRLDAHLVTRDQEMKERYSIGGTLSVDSGAYDFRFLTDRSEEHTSELQSLMRISYAVFCLKKKKKQHKHTHIYRSIIKH